MKNKSISIAIMKFFNEHENLALSIVAVIVLTMLAILIFELFYLKDYFKTEEVTTWEAYLKSYLSQPRFLR